MHEKALKYLKVLELEKDANFKDIKKSYKLLAMAWHPDRFGNEKHKASAQKKQKKINEAYRWLSENKEILQELSDETVKQKTKKSKSKQASSKTNKPKNKYQKKTTNRSSKSQNNYIEIGAKKYNVNKIKELQATEISKYHFRVGALVSTFIGLIGIVYGIYLLLIVDSSVGLILFLGSPFLLIVGGIFLLKDELVVELVYKNGKSEKLRTHKLFGDKPSLASTKKENEKDRRLKKEVYSNIDTINSQIKKLQRK